jgi:hypothetical protein
MLSELAQSSTHALAGDLLRHVETLRKLLVAEILHHSRAHSIALSFGQVVKDASSPELSMLAIAARASSSICTVLMANRRRADASVRSVRRL